MEGVMDAVTHSRKLDEVQRGVETALRNFAGHGTSANDPSEPTAMERIDRIGNMSALAIVEASETTAKDIKAAAQAAVDVAAEIMNEADQLATELRTNGEKISQHLREFAALAKKVSTAMRDTRAEVSNSVEDNTLPGS
jgi:phage-related tail protein